MKRYRKKVKWRAKAVLGLGLVLALVFVAAQATTYVSFWVWGPNTGHRLAGLSSGHYERRYPGMLQAAPTIGVVLMSRGERLTVDYDLTVHEGKVSFAVWQLPVVSHRPKYVGPRIITSSGSGRVVFTAKSWGFYRLYMYGHRWQGDISVDWRKEEAPRDDAASGSG